MIRTTQLKPGKPLQRGKPMRRSTGIKTSTKPTTLKRTAIKSSRPKTTKIRSSANGESCTLQLPGVCDRGTETVVWAHSNRYADGKSAGKKAPDEKGAYACYSCHMTYDRQRPRPAEMTLDFVEDQFTKAMERSREKLKVKGLI